MNRMFDPSWRLDVLLYLIGGMQPAEEWLADPIARHHGGETGPWAGVQFLRQPSEASRQSTLSIL